MQASSSCESFHHFFMGFMADIAADDREFRRYPQLLGDLCGFFGLHSGFIYLLQRDIAFALTASHGGGALPPSLPVGALLPPGRLHHYEDRSLWTLSAEGSAHDRALCALFGIHSLLAMPVAEADGSIIGILCLGSPRGEISLDTEGMAHLVMAMTVLRLHIRVHFDAMQVAFTRNSLESVMDNMGIDIYVNDFNTHEILYVNQSMAAPYGGVANLVGRHCWEALVEGQTGECGFCPQKKLLDEGGNPTKVYSWDYQRSFDGSWFRVFSAAFRWVDDRLAHVVSSVDITESKRNEEIIRQMAEFDGLTGLPNRQRLFQDGMAMIDRCRERDGHLHIVFFDLDDFKEVNDTLGHRAGDELLTKIGEHLQGNDLTRNRAYRHSGDEFVLLLEDYPEDRLLDTVAFLLETFGAPWRLNGGAMRCPTSIGVARYPENGNNMSDLLNNADKAMYSAKRRGKGMAMYCVPGRLSRS